MTDLIPTTTATTAIPSPSDWANILSMTATIYRSGLAPQEVKSPEAAAVIALKGLELNLPPMQALSHIHVINGKPTLSAELMGALVQRAGHTLRIVESTDQRCEIHGIRADDRQHVTKITWDLDRARNAGLLGSGTWKKFPAAMLRSRATSELCRAAFPDVLMGSSYTPDELGADVTVADDGTVEVIETTTATDTTDDLPDVPLLDDQLDGIPPAFLATLNLDALRDYAALSREHLATTLKGIGKKLDAWHADQDATDETVQADLLATEVPA